MYIDPHCHLDDPSFTQLEDVLKRAHDAHIDGFLIPGVYPTDAPRACKLAQSLLHCKWAVGLHPERVEKQALDIKQAFVALADVVMERHPAAVGEIGLDRRYTQNDNFDGQVIAFRTALSLARAFDRPVILHIVGAHELALEHLKKDGLPKRGGVLHACSASAEQVRTYLDLGLYVAFAPSLLNADSKKIQRAFLEVPRNRRMIETDAPGFPIPNSTTPNEPQTLIAIAEAAARITHLPAETILQESAACSEELFGKF